MCILFFVVCVFFKFLQCCVGPYNHVNQPQSHIHRPPFLPVCLSPQQEWVGMPLLLLSPPSRLSPTLPGCPPLCPGLVQSSPLEWSPGCWRICRRCRRAPEPWRSPQCPIRPSWPRVGRCSHRKWVAWNWWYSQSPQTGGGKDTRMKEKRDKEREGRRWEGGREAERDQREVRTNAWDGCRGWREREKGFKEGWIMKRRQRNRSNTNGRLERWPWSWAEGWHTQPPPQTGSRLDTLLTRKPPWNQQGRQSLLSRSLHPNLLPLEAKIPTSTLTPGRSHHTLRTRRKAGLTNFQQSLQYRPGLNPIICWMSLLNLSTPAYTQAGLSLRPLQSPGPPTPLCCLPGGSAPR